MKTVTELKQDRQALLSEAEALLDAADSSDRAMTAEEQSKYDAAVLRVTEMNADIERRMKLEAAAAPTFGDKKQQPTARMQPSDKPDDEEIDEPQATIRQTDRGPHIEIPRSYGKLVEKYERRGRHYIVTQFETREEDTGQVLVRGNFTQMIFPKSGVHEHAKNR